MRRFSPGTRVRILAGCEFPEGATGSIADNTEFFAEPGIHPHIEWLEGCRSVATRQGLRTYYMVKFDTPLDDGSGDGPYTAGEIAESHLALFAEPRS